MLIIFIFLRAVNQSFQQGSLKRLIHPWPNGYCWLRPLRGKETYGWKWTVNVDDEMKPDFSPGTNARFSETEWVAAKWGMAASRLRVLSEGFHYKNCSSAFRRNYCSNSTSFISIFAILEHNCSERGQFRTNSCCSDEGKQRMKRKRTIK